MSDDLFERRQAERRYALNFLDYEILAEAGEVIGRGLARTLNVSESGLRLETGQFRPHVDPPFPCQRGESNQRTF